VGCGEIYESEFIPWCAVVLKPRSVGLVEGQIRQLRTEMGEKKRSAGKEVITSLGKMRSDRGSLPSAEGLGTQCQRNGDRGIRHC